MTTFPEAATNVISYLAAFILRCSEKRIQSLIVPGLLDYSSLTTEFESIQFESDWSFFRSLTPKRKQQSISTSSSVFSNTSESLAPSKSSITNGGRTPPGRPPSPPSSVKTFNSLRQTIGRNGHTPLANVFPQGMNGNGNGTTNSPSPSSVTAILSSLHSLLRLYSINPSIIVQAFSQIYYWVACETFNKMIVQKKYLCRSRAMQIGMNVSILEEWVTSVGLPASVSSHFQTLRELLIWLQVSCLVIFFWHKIDLTLAGDIVPFFDRSIHVAHRYNPNNEVPESCSDEACCT